MHRWAEIYYQQLDALRSLREQVRRDLVGRRPEIQRDEVAVADFFDWTDSKPLVEETQIAGSLHPAHRDHGAAGQNSRSFTGAGKQEKLRPQKKCFFLTPPL